MRYQLSQSLGGLRGMLESAVPFIGFTVAWVASRQLYLALGVAVGAAVILAVIRLAQRQSLKYVAQAVVPDRDRCPGRDPDRPRRGHLPARHPLQRRAGAALAVHRGDPPTPGGVHHRSRGRRPDRLGQGPRAGEDDHEAHLGAGGSLHHPVRHPDAALPRRPGGLARRGEGRARLAVAGRRARGHRHHAVQGQDPDGGVRAAPRRHPTPSPPEPRAADSSRALPTFLSLYPGCFLGTVRDSHVYVGIRHQRGGVQGVAPLA